MIVLIIHCWQNIFSQYPRNFKPGNHLHITKNKNYPEQLKHKTCKNEFMRSKSEAMIAMSLYVQKNSLSL